MGKLRCWWYGCEGHPQDPSPPELLECMHCNEIVQYGDMVGDTRHNKFMGFVRYWFRDKWKKCRQCGHRLKCDESIDHIPF